MNEPRHANDRKHFVTAVAEAQAQAPKKKVKKEAAAAGAAPIYTQADVDAMINEAARRAAAETMSIRAAREAPTSQIILNPEGPPRPFLPNPSTDFRLFFRGLPDPEPSSS